MKLETFKKLHGFFIEDLQLDQTDKIERKITEKDIDNFAKYQGRTVIIGIWIKTGTLGSS